MHAIINFNGEIITGVEVGISPVNAGLLHGYGVFTTLRIYNGHPFLFNEHWQRLDAASPNVDAANARLRLLDVSSGDTRAVARLLAIAEPAVQVRQ